jgi:Putative adhesin
MNSTWKIIQNFGEKKKSLATFSFCLMVAIFFGSALCVAAQGPVPWATPVKVRPLPKPPKADPMPAATPEPPAHVKRRIDNMSPGPAEKSIVTDAKINISLCITSGELHVSGWERNEVRAYVDGGSSVGFRILKTNETSNKPAWVQVLSYDPIKNKEPDLEECLEGDNIELDVPFGAVLNVKSKESEIAVDSITKVRLENVSGSISINNVKEGVLATTFEGDITVGRCNGSINVTTTAGKILVFDSHPNEIGEIFRAKSRSGIITLQKVEHVDVEASSLTGSLNFNGPLQAGGQYKLTTTSGKIELTLPANTSAKVVANYGGLFETKISPKSFNTYNQSGIKKFVGQLGDGDSSLILTTYNGSILIKPDAKK